MDNAVIEKLMADNEFVAAGYMEDESAPPMMRITNAYFRHFENAPVGKYDGEKLWPCGAVGCSSEDFNRIAFLNYSFSLIFNSQACRERGYDELADKFDNEISVNKGISEQGYGVGGNGYTHSIPNYGRVLREGLDEHARRSQVGLDKALADSNEDKVIFYRSMLKLIDGVKIWHRRLLDALLEFTPSNDQQAENRDALVEAFSQVPFKPARNFAEAVVAYNFTFYLDGCDNQGCVDKELAEFYDRDVAAGILNDDQALAWLDAFSEGCMANWGWTTAIGGSNPDGTPFYHRLTELYIKTLKNRPRPNTELKIRPDTPDEIWDIAIDSLRQGNANPAFYNDPLYLECVKESGLCENDSDATLWCGCGCTETMIHGRSCVGSIDAGLNMLAILEKSLQEHLADAESFDTFAENFKADLAGQIENMVDCVNEYQQLRAEEKPHPLRSLLIDDCIDVGREYYNGGARYDASNINFAGLSNVADSLAAVRKMVYMDRGISAERLLEVLADNFEGNEELRQQLLACPKFGNDDDFVDMIACDIAEYVYQEVRKYKPWRGGVFMPSCIMFETYAMLGQSVGATPEGRLAGAPIVDSIGPMQGRDVNGPTAMLKSVTKLPLRVASGTPVLNMRFGKAMLDTPEGREGLKNLIQTYFAMGGLQMQISVLDRAVLQDAIEYPEKHEDLIVRIGGYSTQFNRLSEELKLEVLKRTEYL